jgi:hypothetical protein
MKYGLSEITPENVEEVMGHIEHSPCSSFWLQSAVRKLRERDILDSLNDVEALMYVVAALYERKTGRPA